MNNYINNKKEIDITNSLETKYPEISKEWHPTKNGDLKSNQILSGSNKKVWWQRKEGHGWQTSIYSRTKSNNTN